MPSDMFHGWVGATQSGLLFALAPLVQGIVKKVKAWLQGRYGPPVLQPYYDLRKFLQKDEVVSEHASWLFLVTPYLVFAAVVTAAGMIPVFSTQTLLSGSGQLFLMIYLLAFARFFTALAGVDTGSSFGAMGSSRDLFVSALAEPVLFSALLAVALPAHSTQFAQMAAWVEQHRTFVVSPAFYLDLIAFMILVVTETGRLPVDNPDTHLELTMIHEGMLLEYSGKRLGLMMWSAWIKQTLLFTVVLDLWFPWLSLSLEGPRPAMLLSAFLYVLKLVLVAVLMAFIEMSYAKMRFFRIPRLLSAAFALSVLAIASEYLL